MLLKHLQGPGCGVGGGVAWGLRTVGAEKVWAHIGSL